MVKNPLAKNIDGRALAVDLKINLLQRIEVLKEKHKIRPGLAIIRVGDDSASQVYVASKKRQCKEIGIRSFEHVLPSTIKQKAILDLIQSINEDPEIHGLLFNFLCQKNLIHPKLFKPLILKKMLMVCTL